jgi:hypothetical protein
MTVGQDVGNQFVFQPREINRDLKAERASAGIPEVTPPNIGDPLSNLEVVEGLTENYYRAWNNVQSLAKAAARKGIDVTGPDLSSPEQRKMNTTFLKALANVRNVGNSLQQGRVASNLKAERASVDPDFLGQVGNTQSGITDFSDIGNTKLTKEVSEDLRNNAKEFNTPQERDAANARLDQRASEFREAAGLTDDSALQKELLTQAEALETSRATLSSSYERNRILRQQQRRKSPAEAKKDQAIFDRHTLIDEIIAGNTEYLNQNFASAGEQWRYIENAKGHGLIKLDEDGKKLDFIPFGDEDREIDRFFIEATLNKLINRIDPQKINESELRAKRDLYYDALKEAWRKNNPNEKMTANVLDNLRPSTGYKSFDPSVDKAMKEMLHKPKLYDLNEFDDAIKDNDNVRINLPQEGEVILTGINASRNIFGKTGWVTLHYVTSGGESKTVKLLSGKEEESRILDEIIDNNYKAFDGRIDVSSFDYVGKDVDDEPPSAEAIDISDQEETSILPSKAL